MVTTTSGISSPVRPPRGRSAPSSFGHPNRLIQSNRSLCTYPSSSTYSTVEEAGLCPIGTPTAAHWDAHRRTEPPPRRLRMRTSHRPAPRKCNRAARCGGAINADVRPDSALNFQPGVRSPSFLKLNTSPPALPAGGIGGFIVVEHRNAENPLDQPSETPSPRGPGHR